MPVNRPFMSREQIQVIHEQLQAASSNFAVIVNEMNLHGVDEVRIEWSAKHFERLQKLCIAADQARSQAIPQIASARMGLDSIQRKDAEKSRRASERRREREAEGTKKPPGRPKKSK